MQQTVKKEGRRMPLVVTETDKISEEQWLEYRRQGIGGSDVASLMGISPFRTAKDLYYDKIGVVAVEDDGNNWVALEMGHLLEDLVARIFEKKTGFHIFKINKMFRHPDHPFMLADVDYFVRLPDGSTAILEIKTTNYNAKDKWWMDGKEIVPSYYESQGRHYMAVMDLDRVFFCCLYGNTEDEVIIRSMERDMPYEEEMIFLEGYFWENHVKKKVPPVYTEKGDLALASAVRFSGTANKDAPDVLLNGDMSRIVKRYVELQKEKEGSDKYSAKIEGEIKRLRAMLISEMGESCIATCEQDGLSYRITYNPVRKPGISKDNLLRLKLQYPEIYKEFVTASEFRRFNVKVRTVNAA